MKGIFLAFESLDKFSGISKKIISQVEGIEQNGHDVSLINIPNDNDGNKIGFVVSGGKEISFFSKGFYGQKISWRIKFKELLMYILSNRTDFVYIRYIHFANPFFIHFLKKLKEKGLYVLLEIPTYPYDLEYIDSNIFVKSFLLIERLSRNKFKKYVDRIVTFSNNALIFGTPTIQISNGVNTDEVGLKIQKASSNIIDIIAVGSIAFWHGFDRVINGLGKYYEGDKIEHIVVLHIVGNSSNLESKKYKQLVSKRKLENYVKFHGKVFGDNLDSLFNKADFAIGCLGVHRKGITNIQSIKNREYCARGIPFMYSEIDKDFEEKDFILKATADDSSININLIIDFLQNKKIDPMNLRDYAINSLTWRIQMKKVIDFINT